MSNDSDYFELHSSDSGGPDSDSPDSDSNDSDGSESDSSDSNSFSIDIYKSEKSRKKKTFNLGIFQSRSDSPLQDFGTFWALFYRLIFLKYFWGTFLCHNSSKIRG